MSAVDLHRLSLPPPYGRTSRALLAFRHIRRFSRFPASRLPARRDCIMRLGLNTSQHSYELGKRNVSAGQTREKYFENFFGLIAPSQHNRRSERMSGRLATRAAAGERTPERSPRTRGAARRRPPPATRTAGRRARAAAHAPPMRRTPGTSTPTPRPAARPRRPSDRAARPARPRRARAQPPAVGARGRDEGVPCSGRPPSPL